MVAAAARNNILQELKRWADYCEAVPPLAAFLGRKYDSAKATLTLPTKLPGIGAPG